MRIEPSTIKFLKELDKNNHKDWFQAHKAEYEKALENIREVKDKIVEGLNKKDVIEDGRVFRIYRDVRFSKDKSPYKNNFGIHFTRAGKERRGGYYLHIEPGKSFVGGGFWAPEPADLKRIRNEFAFDDTRIRKIISQKTFKTYFSALEGEELTTAPSGFDKNHPSIDLIRKKQFTIGRRFKDSEVTSTEFIKEAVKTFEAMRPFFDYMSEVLTTDLNGQSI